MAKQSRAASVRTKAQQKKAAPRKAAPRPRRAPARAAKPAVKRPVVKRVVAKRPVPKRALSKRPAPKRSAARRPVGKPPVAKRAIAPRPAKRAGGKPVRQVVQPTPPPPAPPAVPRKPGFYEAVAIYERGVQGLQRHDYAGAAELFRTVIERYPEERELLERARLYLRVCERETARNSPPPETPAEQVYAATVSLNAGDHVTALHHLQRAVTTDPDNDHAHYIMSAALSMRGRLDESLEHLQRSIELNPENRTQARQDPDLENVRLLDGFRAILDAPPSAKRRARRR